MTAGWVLLVLMFSGPDAPVGQPKPALLGVSYGGKFETEGGCLVAKKIIEVNDPQKHSYAFCIPDRD